jgi:hypothetical protein
LGAASDRAAQAAAVREVTLAIEYHLDTLARELAGRKIEPRLLGRAQRIESQLRDLLAEAWDAERALKAGRTPEPDTRSLADSIRASADEELDLVFEQLRDVGSVG